MKTRSIRTVFGAAMIASSAASGAAAQLAVDWRDGDLGGTVDLVLRAPAGTAYLDVLSLTNGPTCFGPSHPVGCIDVGLELLSLTFQVPGLLGVMGNSGELVVRSSVPNDAALDGLVLHQQMVSLAGGKLTAKSKLCRVLLGEADSWAHSVGKASGDTPRTVGVALSDERILLVGGTGTDPDVCEIFHPCRLTFWRAAAVPHARSHFTATVLRDGRVLVVGGADATGLATRDAMIYDVASDRWTIAGPLGIARAGHTASLLPTGEVLIVGGSDDVRGAGRFGFTTVGPTEIFDPATETFSRGPGWQQRALHTATTLADGRIFVAGGLSWAKRGFHEAAMVNKGTAIFDPLPRQWIDSPRMIDSRFDHGAMLLPDGRVLLVGGIGGLLHLRDAVVLDSTESFVPGALDSDPGPRLSIARSRVALARIGDGSRILLAGGHGTVNPLEYEPTDLVETLDLGAGSIASAASLPEPRAGSWATPLANGLVALFGGAGTPSPAALYRD